MKKLLVLMLVLGMGSLASAALVLDVPGSALVGADFVVTITGTTDVLGAGAGGDIGMGLYGDGAALIRSGGPTGNAGLNGIMGSYNSWDGYELTAGEAVSNGNAADDAVDGIWFEFTGNSAVMGTFTFDFYNYDVSSSVATQSGSINIIPEPMTFALLGLGGLFLRRRK